MQPMRRLIRVYVQVGILQKYFLLNSNKNKNENTIEGFSATHLTNSARKHY